MGRLLGRRHADRPLLSVGVASRQRRPAHRVADARNLHGRMAGAQERQQAFVDLYKLEGTGACMNALLRERSQALAMRIRLDLGRGGAAAAG